MFTQKKNNLFPIENKSTSGATTVASSFVQAGLKKSAVTSSGNGAMKYKTTGNPFVDQFGGAAQFRAPRSYNDISTDMSTLWASDPLNCVKLAFYLRTITRVCVLPNNKRTETTQRGQGLKHEGVMRMLWLSMNHTDAFWRNITLYLSASTWKDIFTMLSYDLQFHGWDERTLDWDNFAGLILAGLENPETSNLVKKYLPQIKANKRCTTVESQADNMIAKWICSKLFDNKGMKEQSTYKQYRRLKSSGTAHEWQKLISKGEFLKIDFKTIHGRALASLVSGKFLKNQQLETKYQAWIESQPVAKYTGYVYELMSTITSSLKRYQVETINKQFGGLVETAKNGAVEGTSWIVVRDTSGSMSSAASGSKVSCYNVAKALALFFSAMLDKGAFANTWIEFNRTAIMHQWNGSTPVEKWLNDRTSAVGNTDFMSVIELFVSLRRQGVPESDFPTGILCISDSEFDPGTLGKTNVDSARERLRNAGFSDEYVKRFKIVLWNLHNRHYGSNSATKFETFGEAENVFYFSGLDGAAIAFLSGQKGKEEKTPQTDVELFKAAMDQELLNLIQI